MFRAVLSLLAFLACALLPAVAAEGRATPTRPGAPIATASRAPVAAARKVGAVEYVSLSAAAAQLGMKVALVESGRVARLTGSGARAELEKDSREATINGLRVFLGEPVYEAAGQLHVSRIDFERCLTPLLRPGRGAPALVAPKTIVLDPGHGGKDHGTSNLEKTYTLDVARRTKKLLESAGHRVVLTRDADVTLDLPQRGAIAIANGAQLFASIHFNALPNDAKTSGVEVFTFAPQHQRSTNSWGPRETGDAEKEASPVNRHDHWSVVLAQAMQRRLVGDLKAFDRGRKLAHWGVLRGIDCPAVLVECGFLTSREEARKIATAAYRQKIAEALAAGIRDYVTELAKARGK